MNISTQHITYTYDASGNLIRKQAYKSGTTTQITDYIDGFVYNNASGTEVLTYFAMPEGRVMYSSGSFTQEYIITDQQGNARISFNNTGPSGTAKVVQENSYYAFGLIMPGTVVTSGSNKHLYNGGSEWQNDYSNLPDYYQTFNRNYDAAIGRFIGVDTKAERAESLTSYQYAGNNPIMYNDPLGDVLRPLWTGGYNTPSNDFRQNTSSPIPGGGDPVDNSLPGGDNSDDGGDYSAYWDQLLSDNGLTVDKGPSVFGLGEDGKIAFFPGEKVNGNSDVLISMISDEAIYVDKGVLGSFKTKSVDDGPYGTFNVTSTSFHGDGEANNLFSFLAKNTDVEWSLVKYVNHGENSDYISTSHLNGTDLGGSIKAYAEAKIGALREFDHNHPSPESIFGPSGCFTNEAAAKGKFGGDIEIANDLIKLSRMHSRTTIIFNVFDFQSSQIIQFDNQNAFNYRPWP